MIYWHWLAGLSLAFVLFERLFPRDRAQGLVRPGIVTDLIYVVFNGHFLGMLLAYATTPLALKFEAFLATRGVPIQLSFARTWPFWLQLVVAFVLIDFLQWCVHNLLHRVPFLWELHKVHHSILHMDFWGSMRFHFGEVLVYKTLLYVPMTLFGFDFVAMFWIAIVSTAIGHFNHANLRVRMGPLRYVLNGPEMHIWHHTHPAVGPANVNFGINLSLWDFLFGTAYLPKHEDPPERLGFDGVEAFPTDPVRQELWPFLR